MIEYRNINPNKQVFEAYCRKCEQDFGAKVAYVYEGGDRASRRTRVRGLAKFERIHANCDGSEDEDRAWAEDVKLLKLIYAENPGIKFEEVKKLYFAAKKK